MAVSALAPWSTRFLSHTIDSDDPAVQKTIENCKNPDPNVSTPNTPQNDPLQNLYATLKVKIKPLLNPASFEDKR